MKKVLIFVWLGIFSITHAESIEITQVDNEITNLLFSGQWQMSDSLIEIQINKFSDNPKYLFMKSYNYYYARYFSNNAPSRDETLDLVHHYAWESITVGENQEESLENNFYLGCAYAFLSRANAMRQEYWTAYWNGKKSEGFFEDVIDENPEIYDAYLNLGVNEYFPAVSITGFTSILAWMGGMSGDREIGLQYFYDVAKNGSLFKDEAKFVLGMAYNFAENDPEEANKYWTELNEKYPENNFFTNQRQRSFLFVQINNKGVQFLEAEIDSLQSRYNITDSFILNGIGYTLINQNRLDDALAVFKVNLKLYPKVANCYDSLAECFMIREENEEAIKYYQIAYDQLPSDTTATEEFKQTLKEGIEDRLEELRSRISS